MRPSWPAIVFGSGAWTLWYGSLFLAFLMLLATGLYACVEPSGPGAGPMLMLMVFCVALAALLIITSVDVAWFARVAGSGVMAIGLFVVMSWVGVSFSWTFLFWATDPNYPHMLWPGRVLFFTHSVLLYAANLWLLWHMRQR